ncbi:phosphate acetyltransferase [Streptococcus ovuberis]|uniref:Phosphate acetyltransferase n=1 Tax=Streptococcus ovuberis TaxID=1936207 RepID=A0A7X6N061_9STRE|nr:phosphate acetyltransferase [Streptococcus ovuberis]NKZ20924.1 phosphate acetyltransferase [Streptococcus ovuberis]
MQIFNNMKSRLVNKEVKIVFPEGEEPRILQAVKNLVKEKLVVPVILGNVNKISAYLEIEGVTSGFEIIDPKEYDMEEMVAALVARRQGKVDEAQARELLKDVNYFGVMLVYMGYAQGMVSGAIHSTADTVRPALQIIKTKPGVSRTSGAFLMVRESDHSRLMFGDCAINIDPDAQTLAEIAIETANTAKLFGIDPRVAMLSFSTKGSGSSPDVDRVAEATTIAKTLRPDIALDGELQFDSAIDPAVAEIKAPNSNVAGKATVFIFPEIQSGNIGYKIAERLGGYSAVGPILQGLNKPVNDLSRGCNADDVYKLTIITATQALDAE